MLLVVLNAGIGFVFKCFSAISPIFDLNNQVKASIDSKSFKLAQEQKSFFKLVLSCHSDFICSSIETFGNLLFLVNLSIPFFFFYKFDRRFCEGLKNVRNILKKYLFGFGL